MRQNGSSRACVRCVTFGVSVVAAFVLTGCAGSESSPTAPSRLSGVATPSLPSRPTPIKLTLVGRVTETPPTTLVEVPQAAVRIVDGPDAGRSGETDAGGFYSVEGLRPGTFTVTVSADGFVSASRAVNLGVETTANFQLARTLKTLSYTLTGDLKGSDGTCSDGLAERPCRIVAFPVHNAGPIEATLEWNQTDRADLDFALFRAGVSTPIVRSANRGALREQVQSEVAGSSVYELHITYASGTAEVIYTLTLSYPN